MENIYRTNYNSIREAYRDIFDALERALHHLGIDCYLIGAQSRDVWINHLDMEQRSTRDIDFLVFIPNRQTWDELVDWLVEKENFVRDTREPYRFYFRGNLLDLLPFGGIEENGEVHLDDPSMQLSVIGTREATEFAAPMDGPFKVVTLPGLCILKLVAYYEKPDLRARDWEDFEFLLLNYLQISAGDQLLHTHDDLLTDDMDVGAVASRVLGRNMAELLRENEYLRYRVLGILQKKLGGFPPEEIDQMYRVNEKDFQVYLMKMIRETIAGILEETTENEAP